MTYFLSRFVLAYYFPIFLCGTFEPSKDQKAQESQGELKSPKRSSLACHYFYYEPESHQNHHQDHQNHQTQVFTSFY